MINQSAKVKQVLKFVMIALCKCNKYQWMRWLLFVSVASASDCPTQVHQALMIAMIAFYKSASTKMTELVLSTTETSKILNTCEASVWVLLESTLYLSFFVRHQKMVIFGILKDFISNFTVTFTEWVVLFVTFFLKWSLKQVRNPMFWRTFRRIFRGMCVLVHFHVPYVA